jgi:hypothetical protein
MPVNRLQQGNNNSRKGETGKNLVYYIAVNHVIVDVGLSLLFEGRYIVLEPMSQLSACMTRAFTLSASR